MKASIDKAPVSLGCAVVTISDSRDSSNDTSGDYLAQSLEASGHRCIKRTICRDNVYHIRKTLSDLIVEPGVHIILCNGGTGYSHRKSTASAVTPLLDQLISGFGELFRHLSYKEIGSSMLQSDAFAGTANDKLIFCLPGSTNACRTAWEGILREQLDSTHRPCNFGAGFHA